MDNRIVLGMSGGVDSSVSAYLLQQQGFEITGITLKFSEVSRCCSEHDVCDARGIAQRLKIEHFTVDKSILFRQKVIDYFIDEYKSGRTPNPCAVCNREVKFKTLFEKARELGISTVATGHYARITQHDDESNLLRAIDTNKDQSYFLGRLKRQWLKNMLFPVGQYTKTAVQEFARDSHLPFSNKEESQEICFIKGNDYRAFLAATLPELQEPGNIIDTKGTVLGTHKGIFFYTIGQRKGIQVNINKPLYVISVNPSDNSITVGEEHEVLCNSFKTRAVNWLVPKDEIPDTCNVKIRSQHAAAKAYLKLDGSSAFIELEEPQMAVTPGQLAVFYKNDIVVGSGWID